ncbi:PREDICTED: ubiquitin-like-conjugating enzyme ATG10 [Eufriesea mexicana]|uniref:ubiquitin-like-conjugating enzyme ATG10 n=1 Tax=Eufriesea mexicana TaxID=516756 RepID=UPI00083C7901|nr:PREDICTED: ubiquitin-like-conjugating enzyme ATG10 [Eufriesea mexicana]XP_017760918.1 PREDICTED: ubiquitin-like-conjugating enzyme ATG10 [Eufriesea mexicana]XP_017760919.1 PREDICTED: ubiquitin-like-conjugating enzyme ATG10 [Eufriesea mexicana]XP_017760921.1 PREDICTED: ubiquitin-like-conjugating enzyme ATG10 [Eufriesea mexicana]
MDGPGTITWEEFLENAEGFINLSTQISDGWELHGNKNIPGGAYIVRQQKQYISNSCNSNNYLVPESNVSDDDFNFVLRQDPFEAIHPIEKPLVTEHHVLWSMSYSVPVLYFNGWKSDFAGMNPVSVEEAQLLVYNTEMRYKELSQAIHPILGTPFLYLHPCMSHELLQITSKSKNKLVSWLSTVAPAALNLKLRSEYYQLTI